MPKKQLFINTAVLLRKIDHVKILKNIYKKELLDKLKSSKLGVNDKIDLIRQWNHEHKDQLNTEDDISTFNIKNGGLMNDWNFDDL